MVFRRASFLFQDVIADHLEREAHNAKWLQETFADAGDAHAIVLFGHANPKWEARWWEPTGFDRFRGSLAELAKAYERPIVVAHGATHTFRIDKPFRAAPNVTRVEVFGPPQRGAMIVALEPDAPELFQFTPHSEIPVLMSWVFAPPCLLCQLASQ